ncbi:MAG: glycosyltransferase family 9 protein [archaeon]
MKIVLIKLGALGDVIRTLPLAVALKKRFPKSELTWITKPNALEIIKTDKNIDKVLMSKPQEEFDVLYNFDIDKVATTMASEIKAKEKFGFYSDNGYASAFNLGAEYYLNTLFDDELKKSNKKTYQEMMFEVAEIPYEKKRYYIDLTPEEASLGEIFLKQNNLVGKKIIGIHIGSSPRWPSKAWHESRINEFIKKIKEQGNEVILFAGPDEIEKRDKILAALKSEGIEVPTNNPHNSTREFAALVNICKAIVCSDSFALHLSIGLEKPTVGLFFCTSPEEVEPYDILTKLVSPKLKEFFPEKMDQYDEGLVKSIDVSEVLERINQIIPQQTLK